MGCCSAKTYDAPKQMEDRIYPSLKQNLPTMEGKVVAITGCTTGTGLVCAKLCAELGATVILLNRDSQRAEKALADVKAIGVAKHVACDLSSFASVHAAADQLLKECPDGIDVLCCNAGIMACKDEATADGFDVQMQANHLSHFLLAAKTMPLLDKAAQKRGEARVVSHSSMAGTGSRPLEAKYFGKNGGDLGGDGSNMVFCMGGRWIRYGQSKLANIVFTKALDDRLRASSSKVKAFVAHPGLAATELQVKSVKDGGMASGFTNMLMGQGQSGNDGACGIIKCCCAPHLEAGGFYGPKLPGGMAGEPVLIASFSGAAKKVSKEAKDMLWGESEKATGVAFAIPVEGQ